LEFVERESSVTSVSKDATYLPERIAFVIRLLVQIYLLLALAFLHFACCGFRFLGLGRIFDKAIVGLVDLGLGSALATGHR